MREREGESETKKSMREGREGRQKQQAGCEC